MKTQKAYTVKWTQKQIKAHAGTDITGYSFEQINQLRAAADLEKIAYSIGVNGLNGYLFIDRNTGEFYKITARSSALFQLV